MEPARRKLAVLIALAMVSGIAVASLGSATEYDEVASVAEGVYLVTGEDNRFQVAAEEAVSVLVYAQDGDVIVQKDLDAGDERAFVITDDGAIVALIGGSATIESAGDGQVRKLEVKTQRIKLASGHGEDVLEELTLQLPEMLVGISGALDGQADAITVVARTDEGEVLRASDTELLELSKHLAVEALQEGTIDVEINATDLDGTLYLVAAQPRLDTIKRHHHDHGGAEMDAEAPEAPPVGAIPIEEIAHEPIAFELDKPASLEFILADGWLLDLSVYDEDGAQVAYLHEGPPLSEARGDCSFWSCYDHGYGSHDERIEPGLRTLDLEAGEYVLFVRAAEVEGVVTLADVDPVEVFQAAETMEVTHVSIAPGQSLELTGALLDLHADDWDMDAFKRVELTLDEETIYRYEATLTGPGGSMDGDTELTPELFQAGTATLEVESLANSFGGSGGTIELMILGEAEELEQEDDEDDRR